MGKRYNETGYVRRDSLNEESTLTASNAHKKVGTLKYGCFWPRQALIDFDVAFEEEELFPYTHDGVPLGIGK